MADCKPTGQCAQRDAAQQNASFTLTITPDGLEVVLNLRPAQSGGTAIELKSIMDRLAEMEVCCDILSAPIEDALAAGSASGVVVARGRPGVHGQDGWLESLIPEVRSRVPHEDESGHIDYLDLGDIFTVHVGEALMRRHHPTPGENGKSVLGIMLPAQPGKPAQFAASLTGTTMAEGDPDLLVAAVAGQPVVVRGGAIVEQIYKC